MQPITILADTIRDQSPDDCLAARDAMVATLRAAGATAIYEPGGAMVPGVTGLDLIACFGEGVELARSTAAIKAQLRNHASSFLQPPAAMRESHMALLPNLVASTVSTSKLNDLLGGPSRFWLQTSAHSALWNVEACASLLVEVTGQRRITTRAALHTLHRVCQSIGMATRGRIACTGSAEFCLRAERLRSDWFVTSRLTRETQLCDLWSDADALLRALLNAYAEHFASSMREEPGDMTMRVPGANTIYYFTDQKAPRLLLSQPLATIVQLPRHLGPLFQLLAEPGLGLDRWLSVDQLEHGADVRLDPKFALAAHTYARANAAYFDDMIPQRTPLRLLGAGTLAQARTTAAVHVLRLLRRVKSKFAPVHG